MKKARLREMTIQTGTRDGKVCLQTAEPIRLIELSPDQARTLAHSFWRMARQAELELAEKRFTVAS